MTSLAQNIRYSQFYRELPQKFAFVMSSKPVPNYFSDMALAWKALH
jgi:hypothetical protein